MWRASAVRPANVPRRGPTRNSSRSVNENVRAGVDASQGACAGMNSRTRRQWLIEALALAGLPRALAAVAAGEEPIDFADCRDFKIDLQAANPRVKYFDLRRLTARFTPNDEFFVFHQTDVPRVDPAQWRLRVGGLVERPIVW